MSNDKLFNPLGVAVPGFTGSPRLPGEQPSDVAFQQVSAQPQAPQGPEPARQGALVAGAPVQQGAAPQNLPPTTIAAGYGSWSARNADDITSQYVNNFLQET
ncbi:MAG: hypothetical protein ACFE0R_18870 [Salinarimonas sp.]